MSETMENARGGGCDWEGLIFLFFKGPDYMNKVFIAAVAASIAVFMAILNNKEDPPPNYCSAIAFLLVAAALLTQISCFVFHSSNFPNGPKVAVIIGLISSAFFTVTLPIVSTYLISGEYAVFMWALVWALYVLLVLVVCVCYLLPFSLNYLLFWKKRKSGSTIKEVTTQMEMEMRSLNYQSGEITSSEAAESGRQETVIDVIDQPVMDPDMVIPTQIINTSTPSVLQNGISSASCSNKVVKLSSEVVQENMVKPAVVCFVLGGGANPTLKAMSGFFRRVWGKHGIANISMLPNGIFVVEFFTSSQALMAVGGRQLLFDKAPVITKIREPDLILEKEAMIPDIVPVWIQLSGLEHWKPSCIKKLAGHVGKPLKIEGTRVLVEVNRHRQLPDWVYFVDTEGFWREQKVHYIWKPVFCESCNNFGHSSADCRKTSGAPKNIWVAKTSVSGAVAAPNINGIQKKLVGEVDIKAGIRTVDKGKAILVGN